MAEPGLGAVNSHSAAQTDNHWTADGHGGQWEIITPPCSPAVGLTDVSDIKHPVYRNQPTPRGAARSNMDVFPDCYDLQVNVSNVSVHPFFLLQLHFSSA